MLKELKLYQDVGEKIFLIRSPSQFCPSNHFQINTVRLINYKFLAKSLD